VITIVGGLLYTGFSEWLNVEVRKAWSYADLMPIVRIAGFELGVSPILQWLVVPTLAFGAVAIGNPGLALAARSTAGSADQAGN
jgi:hypothetical protein